jgi:peptide/nickel transport system permease protein
MSDAPRLRAGAQIGIVLVGALFLVMALSLVWTPYDPLAIDLDATLAAPSAAHWLGTDEFGRDVLSRAMAGARISALIAAATTAGAVGLGAAIGLVAGFARGWVDRVLMSVNDALLAFPGVLLAIALMAVFGGGAGGLILALGLAYLPAAIRVVRGAVLSIREREYVEASRVMGNSELYSMVRHVLPNAVGPIAVLAASMFGWVILAESALSFLGLGVAPPAPTWGNMLASARPFFVQDPWLGIAPGLLIAATLLGVNLLGDALRDALDPKTGG